jgi:GDP-D-mannose dehydratase
VKKIALIFGVTGQDGAYLSKFLIGKGYIVHGVKRRASSINTYRVDNLYSDPLVKKNNFYLHYGDVTDSISVFNIINKVRPNEIYNLAAQSHVAVSFDLPEYTTNVDASGTLRILESIVKIESPYRGETFVTKKVVKALCNIKFKKQEKLFVGNLNAKRDWGHAEDYVIAMWKILNQKKPDDFVICTGKQYSIKQFINFVSKALNMKLKWKGKGINEKAYDKNDKCIIECSKKYFRPAEVDTLIGDSSKAKKTLKWKPRHNIHSLINDMISYELKILGDDK